MSETTPAPWTPGTPVEYTAYLIDGRHRQVCGVVAASRITRSGRVIYTVESESEGREVVEDAKLTLRSGSER